MSKDTPAPGALVAYWDDNALSLGVVCGEERGRLRVANGRGRIDRLTPARVVVVVERSGPVPQDTPDSLAVAARRATQATTAIRALVPDVDVPLLWQVAIEAASGDPRPVPAGTLAGIALGREDGVPSAAVVLALHADGLHFTRRPDGFEPRTPAEVEERAYQRDRRAERERRTEELHTALREVVRGGAFRPSGGEHESRAIEALERFAIQGEDATPADRDIARSALDASGLRWDTAPEGAFRLLRLLGRFESDDENLALVALGVSREFPEAVEERSRLAAARGFARERRVDRTDLESVSIDGPSTREIDDALSVEESDGGGLRLGIHLADPGAFLAPDDPVDAEALARALTHYHPDARIPMLPRAISEDAASLVAGRERPVLSVLVDLDATGEIVASRIERSILRVAERLDYESVDRALASGDGPSLALLGRLSEIGGLREERRLARGAIVIDAPEVDVFADGGVPRLERMEAGSPARRAVAEAMVLAGEICAGVCRDAGLPVIFRRQAPPSDPASLPRGRVVDPVLVRRVRRRMQRAEIGTSPGRHAGLGLDAYVQITSALRRFQDLAAQRQIAAHLAGEAPPYDRTAMQRIAALTERAEIEARRAERVANDYWLLRWLERGREGEIEAIVVETEPRPIVQLVETLWEQAVPAVQGAELGEVVRLRIERINPRAGILSLRRA